MVKIRGGAIADNFAENFRLPFFRVFESFQHENGGALAERETVTLGIERAALSGGEHLQRIESGENQLTEAVIAASQRALGATAPHQFPGMADGVRPGGAGVGD